MQENFEQAFSDLITSWERHEQLRKQNASFLQLLESRDQLMRARIRMSKARRVA